MNKCVAQLVSYYYWQEFSGLLLTVCAIQREKISFSVLNSNKIPIFIKRIESLQVFLGFYETPIQKYTKKIQIDVKWGNMKE